MADDGRSMGKPSFGDQVDVYVSAGLVLGAVIGVTLGALGGYLLGASDGGVFNFSDCPVYGSLADGPPSRHVAGLASLGR